MDILISNNTDQPIYEQIREQIKIQIINGVLREGDALPSMRLLAKDLRISIITTKRAYEELEREGFIESYTGRGSFVKSVNRNMVREKIASEIGELFEKAVEKAVAADIPYDEMQEMLKLYYESGKDEEK